MYSNWVNSLDMLAASGVIDFDAPAYILDQQARYVGNPQFSELPMTDISLLPKGTKLKDLPNVDEFNNSNKDLAKPPTWKKRIFQAIVALGVGTLAVLGLKKYGKGIWNKCKNLINPKTKPNKSSKPNKSTLKNLGTKIWNFIKSPFVWIAGKFKKKTP